MVLVEAVSHERGILDMDTVCLAELHSMYWAMNRRNKLQSIHRVKLMKTEHTLVSANESKPRQSGSLAQRGMKDVDAFMEFYANSGIPISFM